MDHSPLIEAANRLLAHQPWTEPNRCREFAKLLRRDGELEWAHRLEEAAAGSRPSWPGSTTRA